MSILKSVLFVLGVCACVGTCIVTTSKPKVGRQWSIDSIVVSNILQAFRRHLPFGCQS